MVKLRYDAAHPSPRTAHIRRAAAAAAKTRDDQPTLAIFDLDGTLTTRDTLIPFLLFYARQQRKWWPVGITPLVVFASLFRMITDRTAKQILIKAFVGGDQEATVEDAANAFARCWVSRHVNHVGMEKLREHQTAGDRIILVSASPDIYVPNIARELGIDEVICTKVQREERQVTGSLVGAHCRRQATVQLLTAHLHNDKAPSNSYAYGASRHNLPMLRWVAQGFLLRRRRLKQVS